MHAGHKAHSTGDIKSVHASVGLRFRLDRRCFVIWYVASRFVHVLTHRKALAAGCALAAYGVARDVVCSAAIQVSLCPR